MKNSGMFAVAGTLYCCLILLTGCSSSELIDIWSDSSFHASSLTHVLVISVSRNPVHRRIWEDAFSAELAKHNVRTMQSYRLFPDAVPDTGQVIQSVRSNDFDGVLVTRRLPSVTNTQYVQGYVANEQQMRYSHRGDRFVLYYRDVVHDGYVDSQKVDVRGIDVWASKGEGRMIWSATSRTPEPNSVPSVRPEIVKLVMADLKQKGIVAAER